MSLQELWQIVQQFFAHLNFRRSSWQIVQHHTTHDAWHDMTCIIYKWYEGNSCCKINPATQNTENRENGFEYKLKSLGDHWIFKFSFCRIVYFRSIWSLGKIKLVWILNQILEIFFHSITTRVVNQMVQTR